MRLSTLLAQFVRFVVSFGLEMVVVSALKLLFEFLRPLALYGCCRVVVADRKLSHF